jgi:hypothetical protein
MRKTNIKKNARAQELMRSNLTYEEIREIIKTEFGDGISNSTLYQLKDEIEVKNPSDLTVKIRSSIGTILELFKRSLEIEEFEISITEKDMKAIKILERLI